MIGLSGEDDIDIVVEGEIPTTTAKTRQLRLLAGRTPLGGGRRRIVFRFQAEAERVLGTDRATGVELKGSGEVIEAGLVIRAVGYRAHAVPDLPFDEERAVVPNERGRVTPGTYVAGWIKRGPNGFIGTNKTDATETVGALLEDARAGLLAAPTTPPPALDAIDLRGWQRIAAAERAAGVAADRPRVKLLDRDALAAAAGR
jgi:ferredoxin--NADP+ reductase